MNGKIVLITGANSGIGKAAASDLAKMGAQVVMMSRDLEKGETARKSVVSESGNSLVDLMECDLADSASIRRFAAEFQSKYDRLDVLINNAGIFTNKRMETADGLEYQIGVNHFGHFLLTDLLLDLIKKSAPARIINVSSAAHVVGRINFEDLYLKKQFSARVSYAQSKLANVLFTYELAHRLAGTGVTVNCLHPGKVSTRFAYDRKDEKPLWRIRLMRPFSVPPEKGAETIVYLASSHLVEGQTGKYFVKKRAKSSSRASYDLETAKRLWEISVETTAIRP
ncbi:MAG TPA: short-chain dehydrogenase [Bacteroidales bacterium]|nr:short-chain dehydrogenase [Bacteroidales bacterium]